MAARSSTARRAGRAAYCLVGPDSYLRTTRREEIIAATVPPEAREFAVARFSLERTALAEALALAATRPMLSPRQVILLTEAGAVGEEDVEALEAYFHSPAEFTVLVFEADKLDRRTRLWRLLEEHCEVFEAESPADDRAAAEAAERFAREAGLRMNRAAVEDLVDVVGTEHGRLRAEVAKLRAYTGARREATPDDVAAVVSPARKFRVFELADLLAERRRADALTLVRRLLEAGESPIGIVGLLAWLYRQLLLARAAPPGTPAWKLAGQLHAPASRVEALVRQAQRFPPEELRAAFGALLEADVALKSSPPNPAAILETLVVKLTGAGKANGRRPGSAPGR